MNDDKPDIFGKTPAQGSLFAEADMRQPAKPLVDPAMIRRKLLVMLAEIRAAKSASPWPDQTTRLNQLLFPQMSNWLPPEERDRLRLEFQEELKRLNIAA